jgi:PHD/YefM family antitoxin component YafN of YafNO toxin-antitoxin module
MNTPQYITDNKGNKISVVLPMKEYKKIMDELEELEDIRLYDEAMADKEPSIPIDKAFKLIEAKRRKK